MKPTLFLFSAVFVAGLSFFAYSSATSVNPLPIKPFVVTYSHYREGGDPSKSQIVVRKVNAKGQTKTLKYKRNNGRLEQMPEDRRLNADFNAEEWRNYTSPENLKTSPAFVGQNNFLGFTVYILRSADANSPVLETWYAVETGPVPLKIIVTTEDGRRLIQEATKVEFREVSDEEMN